jgi:hypothetical protein
MSSVRKLSKEEKLSMSMSKMLRRKALAYPCLMDFGIVLQKHGLITSIRDANPAILVKERRRAMQSHAILVRRLGQHLDILPE